MNIQFSNKQKIIAFIIIVILISLFCVKIPNILKENFDENTDVNPDIVNIENEVPNDISNDITDAKSQIIDGPSLDDENLQGIDNNPSSLPSNYYFLDDGANGEFSIQHNLCSKSCCSEQWPTPFKLKNDPYVCKNKKDFVPSRMMCNNSFQDSGCLCLTRKQAKFIYNRGTNGREWF